MDFYSFAPIAAILDLAYAGVTALSTLVAPFAGDAAAALAVVLLTLIVRTGLIPVGISQVRAEFTRRRIAPQLQELQRRYKKRPEVLQEKMMQLYRDEKASPFAGMLPALAQAPVLSIVYGLFVLAVINGHANALLGGHLFGVTLGTSLVSGAAGWGGVPVFAGLLLVIGVVAWFSRRSSRTLAALDETVTPQAQSLGRWLSWLPFITVIFAGVVPLAATIYLAVTTTWTFVERAILRRALRPTG